MSDKHHSARYICSIVMSMLCLVLCLALASLVGCSAFQNAGSDSMTALPHEAPPSATMPAAAWSRPATGEDPLDKAAFDQAMGMVMNGQYQQASRQFGGLLTRLEATMAAARQPRATTNPAEAFQQATTAPAGGAGATVRMAGESMFWVAYCAEKQGQASQAAALYNKVLANYPGTPAASQAAKRLNLLKSE